MKRIIGVARLAAAVIAAGVLYIDTLPAIVVAVGVPVRQDDLLYTVTRVDKNRESASIPYVV
jgi:hypothetical protein